MLLQAVALKLDRHNMPAIRRVCALLRTLTVPEAGQRRENRLTPERLKQLVVEALWLGFLVAVIWMVLRIVGL